MQITVSIAVSWERQDFAVIERLAKALQQLATVVPIEAVWIVATLSASDQAALNQVSQASSNLLKQVRQISTAPPVGPNPQEK